MRTIGIFTVKHFVFNEGLYYTNGGFGEYLFSILKYFDMVIVVGHVYEDRPTSDYYVVSNKRIKFYHLPRTKSELDVIFSLPKMFYIALKAIKEVDVVNARMPDYTGVLGNIAARLYNKPCYNQIIDDWAFQAKSIDFKKKTWFGNIT